MMIRRLFSIVFLATLIGACKQTDLSFQETIPSETATARKSANTTVDPQPYSTTTASATPPGIQPAVDDEIPLRYRPARDRLVVRFGIPASDIKLLSFEPIEWPDSCLGAPPQPGETCVEVITAGQLLVFEIPQGIIEVHTDQSGKDIRIITDEPYQDETLPVVIWERTGGLAGVCERLSIARNGSYVLEDCIANRPVAIGKFENNLLAELLTCLDRYKPHKWNYEPPAGAADIFLDRYTFLGNGVGIPTHSEMSNLNDLLAKLAAQARYIANPD